MSRNPADLIHIADLVKLAAQTARVFSDADGDGGVCKIMDAAQRIEAAAEELAQIGHKLAAKFDGARDEFEEGLD